jgi:hypothetical protein
VRLATPEEIAESLAAQKRRDEACRLAEASRKDRVAVASAEAIAARLGELIGAGKKDK